jgi:hypothetical protein
MTSRLPQHLAREWIGRLALVMGAVAVSLLALEIGIRAWHGRDALLDWHNDFLPSSAVAESDSGRFMRDPLLGYVMRANFTSPSATHDAAGFRVVPGAAPPDGSPILVVGDSFAYGDDVADDGAWPALLQPLIRRRVLNAGVPAYGLDQSILRLERLAPAWRPALAILTFIPDDVRRLEMSRSWGAGKPYFVLEGETLQLRNVPVPPDPPRRADASLWHRLLGWSYLLNAVETRVLLDRHEWIGDSVRALPRGSGETLVCPLMARLARLKVPVLVVAQYEPRGWRDAAYDREQRRLSARVLECARAAGLATLDLHADTDRAVRAEGYDAIFYGYHHTARGNRIAAEAIAAHLRRLEWPPAP